MAKGPIRTVFATAAILCGAGLALSVVGYAAGGRPSQGLFGIDRWGTGSAASQAYGSAGPMEELSVEGTKPQNGEYSLDVDLSVGDVTIEDGDAFAVEANVAQAVSARWDGNTYQVCSRAGGGHDWDDLEVTVTVPAGIMLQRAEIGTDVGAVTADALRARTVELSADTGGIEVDALWAEELECSASAGSIRVYDAQVDSAAHLDADADSIEASGTFSGRISAECDVGSILLSLEEPADYGYHAQGDLGSIVLGDREFGGMDFDHSEHTDAATFFDLSSDMGSIEIDFS